MQGWVHGVFGGATRSSAQCDMLRTIMRMSSINVYNFLALFEFLENMPSTVQCYQYHAGRGLPSASNAGLPYQACVYERYAPW